MRIRSIAYFHRIRNFILSNKKRDLQDMQKRIWRLSLRHMGFVCKSDVCVASVPQVNQK